MKYRAILWWLWVSCLTGWAAEKLPPKPANYFNDYAAIISPGTVQALNHQLADFERQTSSQLIVAIYPTLQTDSAMEDYTVQILRSWGIGQKDKNNGAVLFIFVKEHKMRIETGYGLEGALPDAICKRIIEDEIAPHFKQQDFNGGVTAGVTAMMAAAKGEYRGTGRTVNDAEDGAGKRIPRSFIRIAVFLFILLILFSRSRGSGLGGFLAGWMIGGGGGGGGGWSGGGGGGGGDGFSGGGGGGGGRRRKRRLVTALLMKPKEFINQLEEKKITSAIGLAEKKTSGEMRVFVSRRAPEDALAAAQVEFKRLKMYETKERNGVLIYVAPKVKKFAVIGDSGVHEKCGEIFWTTVAGEMTEFFKRGEFTEGIIHAIEKAGEILGRHFPAETKGINQLPDEVEHD